MKLGFLPCVAGSGATTLALSTATVIAGRGQSVVLLDGDPSAELSALLRQRPARPLQDLLAWGRGCKPPPALPIAPRLSFVPMQQGRLAGGGAPLRAHLRATLDAYRDASFVLVDLAPPGQPLTSELLPLLDEVLLALPAHGAGLRALPAALRLLLSLDPGERPRVSALSVSQGRAGGPSGEVAREVRSLLGAGVSVVEIPWSEALEASSLRGEALPSAARTPGLEAWVAGLHQRGPRGIQAAVAPPPPPAT
jgi:cellulose biosynthesis protein BcsQ